MSFHEYISATCFLLPTFLIIFFIYFYFKLQPIATLVHTDQRYITALLDNDTVIIREIYTRYAHRIKHYIMANSGSEDDAADIFQEALVDIYNQARQKQLQLTCPFEPFLLLVCKRKWLNLLKKRGREPVTNHDIDVSIGEDVFAMAEQMQQHDKKMQVFLQCFEKLGQGCKDILRKCLGGEDQSVIAEQLKVSYGYLRKKKSECMASLTKMIQSQLQQWQ